MADAVINASQGMDLLKLLGDVISAEQSIEAVDPDLPKDTFAQVVEQIPTNLTEVPLESKISLTDEIVPDVEVDGASGLEGLLSPVALEQVVFKERASGRIHETSRIDTIAKYDASVVVIDPVVPTESVIKVLSRELSSEDVKLYVPQTPELKSLSSAIDKPELPSQLQATLANQAEAVEKITFTPEKQAEVKVETTPKSTEVIQQENVGEKLGQTILSKAEITSKSETVIADPQEQVADKMMAEAVEKKKPQPVAETREVKADIKTRDAKIEAAQEQETRVESVQKSDVSQVAAPEKTTQAKHMTQLVQTRTPHIMNAVAVNLKQAIHMGADKVTVHLNPPALGKIQVEMQFAKDGRVNAILYADKIETFELLKNNPQLLKESIAGAGVNPETTDLTFNFRNEHSEQQQREETKSSWPNSFGANEIVSDAVIYRKTAALQSDKQVDIHA